MKPSKHFLEVEREEREEELYAGRCLSPEARAYLASIGRKGGKKSKRSLSSQEARAMASKRAR